MWRKRLKKIFKVFFISIGIAILILLILPYCFSVEERKMNEKFNPFPNSFFTRMQGSRVHYRFWDSPNASKYIVLIHGMAGSTFSFRKITDSLIAHNCFVLAIDMPGFGYSDKSDTANYTDTAKVEIIARMIRKINPVTKWSLVGHSMGANIIGTFATKYPELVDKLIFIDGAAMERKGEGPDWKYSFAKFGPLRRWAEVLAKHNYVNKEKFNELLESAYSSKPDTGDVTGYIRPFEYEGSATAILNMAAYYGYAKTAKTTLNKIPSLLIWGDKDTWVKPDAADQFKKQNPYLTYKRIRGAGHCPMETHSNAVNSLIIDFLQEAH
jgi:pimeloyl-ACP methyl ester carboxylesterase